MSNITQASLTLFSQSCLSTTLRSGSRPKFSRFLSHHISTLRGIDRFSTNNSKQTIVHQISAYRKGASSYAARESPQRTSILERILASEAESRNQNRDKRNVTVPRPLPTITIDCPNRIAVLQSFRKAKHVYRSDVKPFTSFRYDERYNWCLESDHLNDSHDQYNRTHTPVKAPVTVFAVLGLLGSVKVEDEANKLSDEEKMKKMKPVELFIARGVLLMCDQEYSKASELFHQALRIAQDEGDDERETLILNLLASNSFESGDFKAAEKLFIDLVKRLMAHEAEPTDPAILELSLKLAAIYSRNEETHGKALKGFKFVIDSLLVKLQDILDNEDEMEVLKLSAEKRNELALLGWSYDWFAKHLLLVGDYKGAVDMLQRALKISSQLLGPLHEQTLILLNDVGTTMAMDQSPETGSVFIERAAKGAIECQSKELASFYVNLGLVNLTLRRLGEARRYCQYSLELASKNRDHHNSDEVMNLARGCLNEVQRLLESDERASK